MHEGIDKESDHESKYNNGEADLVIQVLLELKEEHLKPSDIGVISPYNAQVNLIRKLVNQAGHAKIEVSTVDGF